LRTAAKLALLVTIIWALVRFGGFGLTEIHWILGQPLVVALAVASVWMGQLFGARRFQLLLRQQKIQQTFLGSLSLVCASQFAGNVLIGTVGGDAIRYLLLAPRTEGTSVSALAAIALDRCLGLLGLLSIGLTALFLRMDLVLASDFLSHLLIAAVAVGVTVAGGAILFFGARASRKPWRAASP
jgi:uncharacterized membrane protein YbhN (UPF0104 family)